MREKIIVLLALEELYLLIEELIETVDGLHLMNTNDIF